jgi:hypothetical protein
MAALCATIGEAKRGKVTGSRMNAEKLMVQCFPFIALLDSMLERSADPNKNYLH